MKRAITIVGFLLALALTQASQSLASNNSSEVLRINRGIKTEWSIQKLDNFNGKDKRTWRMRSMVDDRYYRKGGPIFIYLFGVHAVTPSLPEGNIITDLARENNGIVFYPEHRYYGESKPTQDLSIENLKFLTLPQALADLAHFIKSLKYNAYYKNGKVIISGCSYGGTMALWFAKFYPNLVHGIWASSAPTLAKVDFKEYRKNMGEVFRKLGSKQCYKRIQNGVAQLREMFAGNRGAEAKRMLNLCSDFDLKNQLDLSVLFESISNVFAIIAQNQREGDIPRHCDILMSYKDDLTAVVEFFIQDSLSGKRCIAADYQGNLEDYKETSYKENLRQRQYQLCNEFGWFQTSSSKKQPFGSLSPVQYFIKMCSDIFGNKYTEENINQLVDQTNNKFRSRKYKVKNMYISYGDLDPWTAVGETKSVSRIAKASHCADLGHIKASDTREIQKSKQHLLQLVRKWLK